MTIVRIGDICGVYKVKAKSNKYTNKGSRCYDCECTVCGEKRTFSESYLIKLRSTHECICDREQKNMELKREFDFIKKHYGEVNLCGSCKYLFSCVRNKYNAIDKRFMKNYYIDTVTDYKKKRNIIIVLECDKFTFDWGEKDTKSKTKPK